MDIKEYSIADFKNDELCSKLLSSTIIPITRQKIASFINNPRANDSDIVLIVAYEGVDVIGYIGIIPIMINLEDERLKVGALTTWWADKKYSGVGIILLLRCLRLYEKRIFVRAFSKSAEEVYFSTKKFIRLRDLKGTVLMLRSSSYFFIPLYSKVPRYISWFLKLFDNILNVLMNIFLNIWILVNKTLPTDIIIEYLTEIDDETNTFIQKLSSKELIIKDYEDFNWFIKYPWIISSKLPDTYTGKHYFSSVEDNFTLNQVKILNNDHKICAFLMLHQVNGKLQIPFAYYLKNDIDTICKFIYNYAVKNDTNFIVIYDKVIAENMRSIKFPFIIKKEFTKPIIISNIFHNYNFDKYHLQDGDGGVVFT